MPSSGLHCFFGGCAILEWNSSDSLCTCTAIWDSNECVTPIKKKKKQILLSPFTHSRLLKSAAKWSWLTLIIVWGKTKKINKKNQDNFVKLSNSLVSEKNTAASVQYVTLPEPALSDLCPAVPLFTTFGSNPDRQSLVSLFPK